MRRIARLLAGAAGITAAVPGFAAAGSGGVTGPAFYVTGSPTGPSLRPPISRTRARRTRAATRSTTSAAFSRTSRGPGPGQPGCRGGRWQVRPLSFNSSYAATVSAHDANGSGDLDSNEEVEAALADSGSGGATAVAVVRSFECPVIKRPASAG